MVGGGASEAEGEGESGSAGTAPRRHVLNIRLERLAQTGGALLSHANVVPPPTPPSTPPWQTGPGRAFLACLHQPRVGRSEVEPWTPPSVLCGEDLVLRL